MTKNEDNWNTFFEELQAYIEVHRDQGSQGSRGTGCVPRAYTYI